jgi:hypothetical protein
MSRLSACIVFALLLPSVIAAESPPAKVTVQQLLESPEQFAGRGGHSGLVRVRTFVESAKIRNIYFEQNADKRQRIGLAPREAQRFLQSMKYECHCLNGNETEWLACPA